MSNISNLFENLMTYTDSYKTDKTAEKKVIKESDATLLNLTVELPATMDELSPDDVDVNVGVMNIETDDENNEEESKDDVKADDIENTDDVTPEDESSEDGDTTNKSEEDESKEESLKLRKEAIRQKRFEAKALREAKKNEEKKDCTGKEDCKCEDCKAQLESSSDVETAKANIRKRVAANECSSTSIKTEAKDKDNVKVKDLKVGTKVYMEIPGDSKNAVKTVKELPAGGGIIFTDGSHVELDKNQFVKLYKESLMHLDTKSLNKLFSEFVKENYKNIDKVVITKAMLENKMLKLEGKILNVNGESTNISLTNRGFDPIKLENKRFIMDFKDTSNTFGIVKESLKLPFVFTCSLKEGVLTFEKLQYSYKTMMESKVARVSGKCTLTEGLFDKKTKDFVYKEMQKVSDFGKAIPSDDGLGFVLEIEAGVKEKLINDLKRLGYNGENGEFVLEKDKQKMKVTFKAAGELTDADGRYRVEFSARKKDVK